MNKLQDIYLSQSCIDVYDTCKLKFKKIYINNIKWSDSDKNFGSKFHLLAQRYYIGLDEVLDKNKEEYLLLENLKNFLKRDKNMYTEYSIKYKEEKLKLLAKVDLINIQNDKIIIYDWKTNKTNIDKDKLENSYQTKIYLHNAAQKFNISPNKIKLVYYNPRLNKSLDINYDYDKHEKYKLELKNKALDIINEESFAETIGKHCSFCSFNSICNKKWININSLLD